MMMSLARRGWKGVCTEWVEIIPLQLLAIHAPSANCDRGPPQPEPSLSETARLGEAFPDIQTLVDRVKAEVPRCLTREQRERLFLAPEPPRWCIELAKQPYDTAEWKQWLVDKLAGKSPPIPDSGSP